MALNTENDLRTKHRPRTFSEIVGQEEIVKTLRGYATGTVSIPHSLLFEGDRGVGKTTSARILAAALNCRNLADNGDPCGECAECRDALAGIGSLAVAEEVNCSGFNVAKTREFLEKLKIRTTARWRVVILDEAQELRHAASEFLKAIEEPPAGVIYVFCTTHSHKLPTALLSRMKAHRMRNVSHKTLAAHILDIAERENIEITDEEVDKVVGGSGGSVRMALSRLEEFRDGLPLSDASIVAKIATYLVDADLAGAIYAIKSAENTGALNPRETIEELHSFYGDTLACRYSKDIDKIILKDKPDTYVDLVLNAASDKEITQSELFRGISIMANALHGSTGVGISSVAQLESAVVQILHPEEERLAKRFVDLLMETIDETDGKVVIKVNNTSIEKVVSNRLAAGSVEPAIHTDATADEEEDEDKGPFYKKNVEKDNWLDGEDGLDGEEEEYDDDEELEEEPEDEEVDLEEEDGLDGEEDEEESDSEEQDENYDDDDSDDNEELSTEEEEDKFKETFLAVVDEARSKRMSEKLENCEVFFEEGENEDEGKTLCIIEATTNISDKMIAKIEEVADGVLEDMGYDDSYISIVEIAGMMKN